MWMVLIVADDNNNNGTNNSPVISTSVLTKGSWRVSYYHESNDDHSSDFSGYVFTFSSNGTLTAVRDGSLNRGTWRNDDDGREFHISIAGNDALDELERGWSVISSGNSEIDLRDDGGDHDKELHFTKI